ncbi:MAG: reverse transcriptase-like protein [Tissierellia bacterium]|nr:reverse transcriptase-like protein [Tissierellia bacterium]
MGKYYYAVKCGRKIGIYETWAECEAQVKGYSGALYKKFLTYEEALDYIYGSEKADYKRDLEKINPNEMVAYVDGSFDESKGYYGYGLVIFTHKGKESLSGKDNKEEMKDMRNGAGEIRGAMEAMKEALARGKDTLYLYYDYMGIEKWATGKWKTNKYGTKEYKEFYDSIRDRLRVVFIKVKAHSGDEYNEEADLLAKEVLGLK